MIIFILFRYLKYIFSKMLFTSQNGATFFSQPLWQCPAVCQGERNLTTRYETELQVGPNGGAAPAAFRNSCSFRVWGKLCTGTHRIIETLWMEDQPAHSLSHGQAAEEELEKFKVWHLYVCVCICVGQIEQIIRKIIWCRR